MSPLEGVALAAGAGAALATLMSAVRTVVVPRGVPVRLARGVFGTARAVFELRVGRRASYERRDRVMALYAPVSLLALLVTWIALEFGAYTLVYLGLGVRPLARAATVSGSALLTLGFADPGSPAARFVSFSEAAVGLILLALLIAYLPTIYGVFSRREAAVQALESRAGSPPSAVEMLERFWRIEFFHGLADLWERWEAWFVELAETHTSFPALVFFRSPEPRHSWVTAAGTVLDSASLTASTLELPREPRAELMIRAGYLALRRIATYFGIAYDPDPRPGDPIAITRPEFDAGCERLAAAGVPLRADRERAWRDFAGWRVNYDAVLLELARLTQAPIAPWTSDRSAALGRPRRKAPPVEARWAAPLRDAGEAGGGGREPTR